MFCEEIRTKQELSYISICSLSGLYNSKLILMATSLRTNAVVVTRVYCSHCHFNGSVNEEAKFAATIKKGFKLQLYY